MATKIGHHSDDHLALINNTQREFPRTETIPSLFAKIVQSSGEQIAVKDESRSLSYASLDAESTTIAAHIQATLPPGDGHIVALLLERSCTTVAAMLATLKCGHTYLPLDPGQPIERLKGIVADSGAAMVLVTDKFIAVCDQAMPHLPKVLLDDEGEPEQITDTIVAHVTPTSIAYTMYTSGSTGKPNAVRTTHRNIIKLVRNVTYMSLDSTTVTVLQSPLMFDVSTFEIYAALLNGGRVVIPTPGILSPLTLATCTRENGVTIVVMSSGLFSVLSRLPCIDDLAATVRDIITGGDVVSPTAVALAYQHLPKTRILCGYGVIECTSFSTIFPIPRTWPADRALPIGLPVDNTTAYILDDDLQTVPVGVIGQLYIGGEGICSGYHNADAANQRRFVESPALGKIYRTGDLASVELYDGKPVLQFGGRVDQQVKIRGFRVELGDIEAAVRRFENVKDVAVVVDSADADNKQLFCFVVSAKAGGEGVDFGKLREHLKATLPDYMIPQRFDHVVEIPIRENGTVDKKRLLSRKAEEKNQVASTKTDTTAKPGSIEETVAGVWANALGLATVDPDASFFELGGHSLLAFEAHAALCEKLKIDVPITTVFAHPSVRGLAAELEKLAKSAPSKPRAQTTADSVPKSEHVEPFASAPVMPLQVGFWQLERAHAYASTNNEYAVARCPAGTTVPQLEAILRALADECDALRLYFYGNAGGDGIQRACHPSLLQLDVSEIRPTSEADQRTQIKAFLDRPWVVTAPPLVRLALVHVDQKLFVEDKLYIWLCAHHIITDDVTVWTLMRGILQRLANGNTSDTVPTTSYVDFARQEAAAQSTHMTAALDYCIRHLGTNPTLPRFPLVRGVADGYAAQTICISSAALNRAASATQTTGFSCLLSAYYAGLCRLTGDADMCFYAHVANRTGAYRNTIMGQFANRMLLRVSCLAEDGSSKNWKAIAQHVFKQLLALIEHQHLPIYQAAQQLRTTYAVAGVTFANICNMCTEGDVSQLAAVSQPGIPGDCLVFLDASQDDRNVSLKLTYHTSLVDSTGGSRLLATIGSFIEEMTNASECPATAKAADEGVRVAFVDHRRFDLGATEASILKASAQRVADCHVMAGRGELNVFVKLNADAVTAEDEALHEIADVVRRSTTRPVDDILHVIAVEELPLNAAGNVDEERLKSIAKEKRKAGKPMRAQDLQRQQTLEEEFVNIETAIKTMSGTIKPSRAASSTVKATLRKRPASRLGSFLLVVGRAARSELESLCRTLSSSIAGVRIVCVQLANEPRSPTATDYGLFLGRSATEPLSLRDQLISSAGLELGAVGNTILLLPLKTGGGVEAAVDDLCFVARELSATTCTGIDYEKRSLLMLSTITNENDVAHKTLSDYCSATGVLLRDLACRFVTVVEEGKTDFASTAVTVAAVSELQAGYDSGDREVVYRGSERYVKRATEVPEGQRGDIVVPLRNATTATAPKGVRVSMAVRDVDVRRLIQRFNKAVAH